MAINARQIYPNDLDPSRAIGVNLPFNGESVFTPNYQTRDAIKNNLVNYLLTNPGERFENPTFGGGLRRFIFSQIENNNLDFIKNDIQLKINQNFSNITLQSIDILRQEDNNTIIVKINYSIPNTNINDELVLNFN
jgi:phage baseplate assembly protein W|tara:strand:+ start:2171 stop:2578 length:408 start_codon:yes stop_codon:yes gene_type:complete